MDARRLHTHEKAHKFERPENNKNKTLLKSQVNSNFLQEQEFLNNFSFDFCKFRR